MKTKAFFQNAKTWPKTHYHWIIAAVALIMIFFHGGSANNLSSLHLIPLSEHLDVSRSKIALALTARPVAAMCFTFFSGFFISKFGSRATATVGMLLATAAYIIMGFSDHYLSLLFGCALLGATFSCCSTAAASQIVRNWFHRHEGAVLGLVTAASGIGASVLCLIQTGIMETFNWRASFFTCAIGVGLATVLVFFLIRNHPKDKGLVPLGDGEEITGKKKRISQDAFPGLPMKKLCRRPSFYLMIFTTFLSNFALYLVYSVLRPFVLDCGYSVGEASGIQSFLMFFLSITKFLTGALSDRVGARRIAVLCNLITAVSVVLLALSGDFVTIAFSVVLFSFGMPMMSIIPPLVAFTLFGHRAQMQYTGVFIAIISASNFAAEPLTNLIYDLAGSYRPSFWMAAVSAVLSILLLFVVYRLADRDKRLPEAQ